MPDIRRTLLRAAKITWRVLLRLFAFIAVYLAIGIVVTVFFLSNLHGVNEAGGVLFVLIFGPFIWPALLFH